MKVHLDSTQVEAISAGFLTWKERKKSMILTLKEIARPLKKRGTDYFKKGLNYSGETRRKLASPPIAQKIKDNDNDSGLPALWLFVSPNGAQWFEYGTKERKTKTFRGKDIRAKRGKLEARGYFRRAISEEEKPTAERLAQAMVKGIEKSITSAIRDRQKTIKRANE